MYVKASWIEPAIRMWNALGSTWKPIFMWKWCEDARLDSIYKPQVNKWIVMDYELLWSTAFLCTVHQ